MRTITLTTNNRLVYLSQILECLKQQGDLSDWHIVVSVEPGPYDTIQMLKDSGLPMEIIQRPHQLGVRDNPYETLKYVFDELGSELNLYLEEDIIVSPDVVRLATWYFEQDLTDILSMHFCNGLVHRKMLAKNPNTVWKTSSMFSPWGLVLTGKQWYDHYEAHWYHSKLGWDWAMHKYLRAKDDLFTLQPECSRSKHIGKYGGVHVIPEDFDRLNEHMGPPLGPGHFAYQLETL